MIGFLIKKTFFDFWDNMIRVVIINLGFILLMGIGIYLPYLLRFNLAGAIAGLFIAVFLFNVYAGAASLLARDIVDYKSTGIREFWEYIKEIWRSTSPLSVITGLQFAVIII